MCHTYVTCVSWLSAHVTCSILAHMCPGVFRPRHTLLVCPGSAHVLALHMCVPCASWPCTCHCLPHMCSLCVLALHMCLSPLHIYVPCMSSPCACPTCTLALHTCMFPHILFSTHVLTPCTHVSHACPSLPHTHIPCVSWLHAHVFQTSTCVSDLYMCPMHVQFSTHVPAFCTCMSPHVPALCIDVSLRVPALCTCVC